MFNTTKDQDEGEEVTRRKREKNRALTINELVHTELDFYIELNACYEAFMTNTSSQVESTTL